MAIKKELKIKLEKIEIEINLFFFKIKFLIYVN